MQKVICLVLMLMILPISMANAAGSGAKNLHGTWWGWSYWTYSGSTIRCDSEVQFKQSEKSLERIRGLIDCQVVYMDLGSRSWMLEDGRMYILNEKQEKVAIGEYTDKHYKWKEAYSNTVMIYGEINLDALHIDYKESWMHLEKNQEVYKIEGRMFLRPTSRPE